VFFVAAMTMNQKKQMKKIEKHFFAIQKKEEQPDSYIQLPQMAFGGV
jgi:hypothetical protein